MATEEESVQVQLPSNDGLVIAGSTERYLLLLKRGGSCYGCPANRPITPVDYFLLDLEMMQLDKMSSFFFNGRSLYVKLFF